MEPQVLVLPHVLIPAQTGHFETLPLSQALQQKFSTDAHFFLYESNQRLLKGFEPEELRIRVCAIDYDLPDHRNARADAALALEIQAQASPLPTHFYLTRGGARLIYVHEPLTPTEAEALHQAIVAQLASQGLDADPNCWQWNRPFRLPKVNRDGQDLDPVVALNVGPQLDVSKFDLSGGPRSFAVPRLRTPMPDFQEAKSLVWEPTQGGRGLKLTTWAREAQRRLRFRMDGELDSCFKNDPLPFPDPRNEIMIRLAGSCARILYGEINTTPDHIFGLLIDRCLQSIRPTDRNRNLPAELHKVVLYCWAQEQGLRTYNETQALDFQTALLKNTPNAQSLEELRSRAVVRAHRGNYYVLQASGFYSPIAEMRETLPNALHRAGLTGPDKLLDLTVENQRGVREMTSQEIITNFCLSVTPEIVKVPGHPPDHGWLQDNRLHFGAYARADLEPRFDIDVDTWLRHLFGRHYALATRWIGLALAFERGPICALSLTSPAGTGKGLLVKGLAEATNPNHFAEAKNIFSSGKFEYGLDDSPWIVADEGWDNTTRNLANRFRTLVGGGRTTAEKKFAHPSSVHVAPRIILTANNRETVEGLFTAPGLTQGDVQAIAQRVFHIDCTNEAAKWLERKGSYDFTHAWVGRLEGGVESDFVVARHFLHLYEEHKHTPSMGRFLMQDLTDPALIAWMTVKNDHVAIMAEALLRIVNSGQDDDGWVTVGQVRDTIQLHGLTRKEYIVPVIARHLRMLTTDKDDQRRRKIDWRKLEFYANETGRPLARSNPEVAA